MPQRAPRTPQKRKKGARKNATSTMARLARTVATTAADEVPCRRKRAETGPAEQHEPTRSTRFQRNDVIQLVFYRRPLSILPLTLTQLQNLVKKLLM